MASWPNFKLFRPKLSPNRTKNGQFHCFIYWILIDTFVRFQTLHSFFEIDVQFRLISKLFSELKFPNFFSNFFAKILRVQKFRFFPKNFWTSTAEHFRNSRKRKVLKNPSNAGPYFADCVLDKLTPKNHLWRKPF